MVPIPDYLALNILYSLERVYSVYSIGAEDSLVFKRGSLEWRQW